MKRYISFLLVLSICCSSVFAQRTLQITGDSILLKNNSGPAELILSNSTKNINGFLYNKGDGRTEFRKAMVKLNDSVYVFGQDTLKITAPTVNKKKVLVLTDGTTITANAANNFNFRVTLGGTGRSLAISNPEEGQHYTFEIKQDGSGNRTVSNWPNGVIWPNGTVPTLSTSANATDLVTFYYNGTNYFGDIVKGYSTPTTGTGGGGTSNFFTASNANAFITDTYIEKVAGADGYNAYARSIKKWNNWGWVEFTPGPIAAGGKILVAINNTATGSATNVKYALEINSNNQVTVYRNSTVYGTYTPNLTGGRRLRIEVTSDGLYLRFRQCSSTGVTEDTFLTVTENLGVHNWIAEFHLFKASDKISNPVLAGETVSNY